MTTGEALYKFFNSFGITAYPTTSVPDDVVFPYMTYDYYDGFFGDAEQTITASLWFYTTSELIPNKKADEIAASIGRGGKVVACDGGAVCSSVGNRGVMPCWMMGIHQLSVVYLISQLNF